jgi:hypothetical protein
MLPNAQRDNLICAKWNVLEKRRRNMNPQRQTSPSPEKPAYVPPRVVRVAVATRRENLQWQYSDSAIGACSNHNHDSASAGCNHPQ